MHSNSADISESLPQNTHISRSPKEDWDFSGENRYKLGCFCITKIRLGQIFSRKKI